MLTGETKPTSGIVNIASYDIIHESIKAKQQIGVVPEVSNIYDEMNAWDNLIFAAKLYGVLKIECGKRAEELLKLLGLYERRKDRVSSFSRGMKRRLTIAAALMHKPKILFLDEPTTGLDIQSSGTIRRLLEKLNRSGTTILLTTHYIEEADQLCQRVAIINQGRTIAVNNPEKLKASMEKQNIIEISYSPSQDMKDKLRSLSYVNSIARLGDKFRLYVDDVSEVIPTLIDFARKNHVKIIAINTLKPSLEDVFIKLTGLSPDVMATEKSHSK